MGRTIQDIFKECASSMRMRDWRLTTSREEFKKAAGCYPTQGVHGELEYSKRLVWVSDDFARSCLYPYSLTGVDRKGWGNFLKENNLTWEQFIDDSASAGVGDLRIVIYHELLHGKYPYWSDARVAREAAHIASQGIVPAKVLRRRSHRFIATSKGTVTRRRRSPVGISRVQ